jgi:hypothetical protein
MEKRVIGPICNSSSVMTVYNPPYGNILGIVQVTEGINVLTLGRWALGHL